MFCYHSASLVTEKKNFYWFKSITPNVKQVTKYNAYMGGKLQNLNDCNLKGKSKRFRNSLCLVWEFTDVSVLYLLAGSLFSGALHSIDPSVAETAHNFLRSKLCSQGLSAWPESEPWWWFMKVLYDSSGWDLIIGLCVQN